MKRKQFIAFLLGFLCFFTSQILLRIPILENFVYKNVSISLFQIKNALLFGIFISISAGIFEEGFRFLFRKFLIKESSNISEAIFFGLGHSFMEIIYIFYPVAIIGGIYSLSFLAIIERIIATLLHIELSILIWYGFSVNKKYRYLFLAIFIHSFVNAIIPIGVYMKFDVVFIEILFAISVFLAGIYIYNLKWRKKDEKI